MNFTTEQIVTTATHLLTLNCLTEQTLTHVLGFSSLSFTTERTTSSVLDLSILNCTAEQKRSSSVPDSSCLNFRYLRQPLGSLRTWPQEILAGQEIFDCVSPRVTPTLYCRTCQINTARAQHTKRSLQYLGLSSMAQWLTLASPSMSWM